MTFGPVGPVTALESGAGRGTPLATMQALAAAVGELATSGQAASSVGAPVAQALPALLPSTLATAHAVQGRLLLGELAAQASAQRTAPFALSAELLRPALQPTLAAEGSSAPRLHDVLATPVLLNPLYPSETAPARPRERPSSPTRAARRDAASRVQEDPDGDAQPESTPQEPDETSPSSRHDDWPGCLQRAGQHAALRELALGRRVLIVVPQRAASAGSVPAQAWLLSSRRVVPFAARWWPGAALVADAGWLPWRVFRDGAPMLENGLRSRSSATACRLRLGGQAPRLADVDVAGLHIADRLRFAHALGAQWSLLVLAATVNTVA